MKVQKFGGTSVGTPQRMKEVARLVQKSPGNLVVLSAMSGTTNALLEIADYFAKGNRQSASALIGKLHSTYMAHIEQLYSTLEAQEQTRTFLNNIFDRLLAYAKGDFTPQMEKEIVSYGEIMSTNMLANYFNEQGVNTVLLNALDFMRIDEDKEPDVNYLREHITPLIEANSQAEYFITQGFICLNHLGEIDNLQRGGSDYTASLIGAAIKADLIEIWTDIDGMHNNDPRYVENTKPVHQLHFEEAAELAYFGAKILHPTCVLPAKAAGIPVKLLNTMQPDAEGTLINNQFQHNQIKAVAAKDDITAIKIVSSRMLLQTGFLRKVFEIFETYHTPIDMVTTSEVGISMTIDCTDYLANITDDLKQYGIVEVDREMCIICVVGDLRSQNTGFESTITNALRNIPIRMISYGGSNHNISFLIHQDDKQAALQALSAELF
ncbi:MAG: aspartate kinase [Bacteroidaceae bacterium]|nr:aspartate kinase [Bacteroidaceae bacterium]